MKEQRRSGHTISQLTVHIVWVTKYRYPVLTGDIQKRCRQLLIQICDAEDIRILKGVVSKDHVHMHMHMHMEYPARLSVSDIVKRLKGRASRRLQDEFPELKKRFVTLYVLGDNRFKQQIEQTLNRKLGYARRGRPRKTSIANNE